MSSKMRVQEPLATHAIRLAPETANGTGGGHANRGSHMRNGLSKEGVLAPLIDRVTELFPGSAVSLLEVDELGHSYVAWHTHTIENCDAIEQAVLEHLGLNSDRRVRLCRVGTERGTEPASVPQLHNASLVVRAHCGIQGLLYAIVVSLYCPNRWISLEEELTFADHAGELVELLEDIKAGVAYELQTAFGCMAIANVPWGVLAFGATGKLLFANVRAEQILSRRVGLRIKHGRLQFDRAAVARTFACVLEDLSGQDGMDRAFEPSSPPRAIAIPGPQGDVRHVLWLMPVRKGMDRPGDASVVGYLTDLMEQGTAQRPLLATIFSLTAKEAQLAELFGSGYKLEQAARTMGISRNTARIHLANIFAKTATHSQVELARVLARLPSRVEPTASQAALPTMAQRVPPWHAGPILAPQ